MFELAVSAVEGLTQTTLFRDQSHTVVHINQEIWFLCILFKELNKCLFVNKVQTECDVFRHFITLIAIKSKFIVVYIYIKCS